MNFGLPSRCLALLAVFILITAGCGTSNSDSTPTGGSPTANDGNSIGDSITEPTDNSIESPSPNAPAPSHWPKETPTPQSDNAESDSQLSLVPGDRRLPGPKDPTPTASVGSSANDSVDDSTQPAWNPNEPTNEEIASKAFQPPPEAIKLTPKGNLWINSDKKRVYLDGYVALKSGVLEMFACPAGTKEHESVVATLAKAREVHAALLAVDATPGSPVRFRPEYSPPTGQVIRIWVCWYDSEDQFQVVDARQWVQDAETEEELDAEWVFAGSGFWEDPDDKREYYMADSGDMICVSNFSSAMLDVSIPSSADTGSLRFVPFESRIPEPSTPVRLILTPVSESPAEKTKAETLEVPTAREIPRAK